MRKIFRNIFASALVLLSTVACVDDRNNSMVDDSLGFSVAVNENLIELHSFEGKYDFSIIKSGKGFDEAVVTLSTSNSMLEKFNAARGTAYVPFPSDLYSLSASEFQFDVEEVFEPVTVSWDVDKVNDLIAENPDLDYVIPLRLTSTDLEVNAGRDLLVVSISKAKVGFVKPSYNALAVLAEPRVSTESIKMQINASYPEAVAINLIVDNDLAAAYIKDNNLTGYTAIPEEYAGLVSLPEGNKAIIPAKTKEFTLDLTMNTGVVFKGDSEELPELFEGYVLPIRAVSVDSDGIILGNDIVYVVITSTYVLPLDFVPVWGLYTGAAATSWFEAINGAAGGDRNVAVDDKYVYVPESKVGGEYIVYTFSVEDGTVGKLKTPSSVKKGDGFTSCAPKVIKNGVSTINNGNDILIVANMTQGDSDFVIYAYVDGVENDPKVVTLSGAGRLGDKINVYGNLNDGLEIIAKDMKSDDVWSFKLQGEIPASVTGTKVPVSGISTGWQAGSLYMHPDDRNQAVLTTTEGGYFLTSADGVSYNTQAWNAGFVGLGGCHDFQFFTVNDIEYISFVRLEEFNGARNKGRVIVLENKKGSNEFKSTLEKAFNDKAPIAFSTPTQHADDFSAVSGAVASNSAMGLSIYETESSIFMATLQQNGGLSLYRLSK